jgi:hypothetical protein
LCKPAPERIGLDEVRERLRAVDLHDRKQGPVPALELGVAGDVHLLQLEGLLGAHGLEHPARGRAEVALRRVVEDDAGYGYRPRVIVASATRWTARP